jgi:uncharacterized protein (TIRG00374 family)
MQLDRRHAAAAVLAWVVVYGVFIVLAGPTEFVDVATNISGPRLVVMMALNLLGTLVMGLVLYTVGRRVGLGISPGESILLNATIGLASNLTPFGQASGLPIGGAIISRWTGERFEKGLAALSMKEVAGFAPAILVFILGGGYIALYDPTVPSQVRSLVGTFSVGVTLLMVVAVAIYRNPDTAQRVVQRAVTALNRGLVHLPWVSKLDETEVRGRVDSFAASVGDVTSDPLTLAVAGTLTTSRVVVQGLLLWVTLTGVGVSVPLAVTVFVIPVSLLASALPLPGGSGGVEGTQILLLLGMAGGSETAIIAGVTVSRGLVFWTPIVAGSLTLVGIQVKRRLPVGR